MKKDIYKNTTTGLYYKKHPNKELRGMYFWQEVKKFLWFYIPQKHSFWLDDFDFVKLGK